MDANEVVECAVQRDRVAVVLNLLAERIGQSSKAAHVHSHGEVLPLDIGSADVLEIGTAFYARLDDARAFSGIGGLLSIPAGQDKGCYVCFRRAVPKWWMTRMGAKRTLVLLAFRPRFHGVVQLISTFRIFG